MTKCRSCGSHILWMTTTKGKLIPVQLFDVHGTQIDEKVGIFDPKEMISHFGTKTGQIDTFKAKG